MSNVPAPVPADALPSRAGFIPPVVTFGWQELCYGKLVGFEGEPMAVAGVRLRGQLASVAGSEHIAGRAGEVADDLPGRWTARDIHGTLWVMLSPLERAWNAAVDAGEQTYEAEMAWREFAREVKEYGGRYGAMGSYQFRVSVGEVTFWNGEWHRDTAATHLAEERRCPYCGGDWPQEEYYCRDCGAN
jgi:hypothetical protein